MAKDTDCGVCFVRSASCAAYGISENLCGVCEGADWQHCANEGGWCTCKGRVRFGEGSNWADESNSQGQMFCTSTKFDKDPSVGKAKTCQCAHGFKLSNSMGLKFKCKSFDDNNHGAGSFQARNVCLLAKYGNLYVNEEKKCADQGGSCVCDGNVRFGADGSWSPPVRIHGEAIACKAGSDFRDPAPSKAKVCMCSSAEYPDYPTAESFAELASTKAPVSIHYYGNCNEKNSKDYTEVRDFFSL